MLQLAFAQPNYWSWHVMASVEAGMRLLEEEDLKDDNMETEDTSKGSATIPLETMMDNFISGSQAESDKIVDEAARAAAARAAASSAVAAEAGCEATATAAVTSEAGHCCCRHRIWFQHRKQQNRVQH